MTTLRFVLFYSMLNRENKIDYSKFALIMPRRFSNHLSALRNGVFGMLKT